MPGNDAPCEAHDLKSLVQYVWLGFDPMTSSYEHIACWETMPHSRLMTSNYLFVISRHEEEIGPPPLYRTEMLPGSALLSDGTVWPLPLTAGSGDMLGGELPPPRTKSQL